MQLARIHNGRLELNSETIQHIREKFPPKLKFCTIYGYARTGKSSLLNLLTKSSTFQVNHTTNTETKGVWISDPIKIKDSDENVVFVDSEGTEHGDTTQHHKILTLVSLLACQGGAFIQMENYGNRSITSLAKLARTCKTVAGMERSDCPCVILLLCNFDSNLKIEINGREASTAEFLNYLLSPKNDELDSDRALIRGCFAQRFLMTMPPPPDHNNMASATILPGPFKTAFEYLEETLFCKLKVKQIGTMKCDGNNLVDFLEQSQRYINEGCNFAYSDIALGSSLDSFCNLHAGKCKEDYAAEMQDLELNGDNQALSRKHNEAANNILITFMDTTQGCGEIAEKYLVELTSFMEQYFNDLQLSNQAILQSREEADHIATDNPKVNEDQEVKDEKISGWAGFFTAIGNATTQIMGALNSANNYQQHRATTRQVPITPAVQNPTPNMYIRREGGGARQVPMTPGGVTPIIIRRGEGEGPRAVVYSRTIRVPGSAIHRSYSGGSRPSQSQPQRRFYM